MIRTIHFSPFIFFLLVSGSSSIHQICKRGVYGNPTCERILLWDSNESDFKTLLGSRLYYSEDPRFLKGKLLKVLFSELYPYVVMNNQSNKLIGFLAEIWRLAEEILRFKTNLTCVEYEEGLHLITAGKADIMLAAAVVKNDLINIEYSQPYFSNWYDLYTKAPKAKGSAQYYLRTFSFGLWITSLLAFVILTIILWLFVKFLSSKFNIEYRVSLLSCFFTIISGFMNQGFDLKLSANSCRILILTSLVLGYVLLSAMNALLVAELAVFETQFPFKTLDDVAKKKTFSLCVRTQSFVYNNFTNENNELLPEWHGIVNTARCGDISDIETLEKSLCQDNIVVLENHVIMDTVLGRSNLPCKIISSQQKMFLKSNSFLISKKFLYRRILDESIKKIKTAGLAKRIEDKWVRGEKLVSLNLPQTPQVTLDHINGILVMYVIMILISFLILLAEKCIHRLTNASNKKQKNKDKKTKSSKY